MGAPAARCTALWNLSQSPSAAAKSPLQLVEGDRQVAHAFSGRVIDRVGYRRRDTDDSDLADAFDAERIDDVVRLVDEDHLDVVYVGVHRHMILGDVGVRN